MGIYDRLGVRTIVNARGTQTLLGGSLMPPEVLEAMAEASHAFVDITELNRKVGEIIARVTGAEAGYVTAGSAAGILLATAALISGTHPARIRQLPDTTGLKNEVIVHRSHRHGYDNEVTAAGARLVEIGHAYRTQPWELEAAINDRTAGVFYTVSSFHRHGFLSLPEVIRIAHGRDVPVYVDAASMLPPASNLQKFVALGADLVIFSGGKGIRGPQSTGLLCGRRDLIEAAALNGNPHQGAIGRAAKVCKEEMVGLATALELYVQRDHDADQERWRQQVQYVADVVAAAGLPGVEVEVSQPSDDDLDQLPEASIRIREKDLGMTAKQVEDALWAGEPRIATGLTLSPRLVSINPQNLQEGEEEMVARRLVEVLTPAARPAGVR